ncbi:MAG: SDR family oxidoreductase [Verrucomicrobia bacterium]|nr:SDR family oxidoreductase [Verrucomicrobiota bacterium]
MTAYEKLKSTLAAKPRTWLVTGVGGFIGSNLLEALLRLDQKVVGLDNFSTGKRRNLVQVKRLVTSQQWRRFKFIEGDLQNLGECQRACRGVEFILHQAALGSVPFSIEKPLNTNASNVSGFLNVLVTARDAGVRRFVYASSSAVYGDEPSLPKIEAKIGKPLSPYAVSKYVNELYAQVFAQQYGMEIVGLRYFNVFGPRQDPDGAYAAVIPKWIAAMIKGEPIRINGDGETSRDFCYIDNVVQANLLAAATPGAKSTARVFNVALHSRTTLNALFEMLRLRLAPDFPHLKKIKPVYQDFRPGDVRHSEADIRQVKRRLGYRPIFTVAQGLDAALEWYKKNVA